MYKLSKRLCPLFVVGGFVRESLLGLKSADIDLAGPHTVDELISVLGQSCVVVKNKALNTAQIVFEGVTYEYSTFRIEEYVGGKHNPKKVSFVSNVLTDARRRDFSCNAIYYDLSNGKTIDPYNGARDIKNKTIRMIENSLEFDGVRILRMIRLALNLEFEIEPKTWAAAKKYSSNLDAISPAIKRVELRKINPQKLKQAEEMLNRLVLE